MKIEKLREKIIEKNLDAYLAQQNSRYLAETPAASGVLVTKDTSVLLCGRLDLDRAERESDIRDVRAFSETELPLRNGEEVIFGTFGEAISEILEEHSVSKVGFDQLSESILEDMKENYEVECKKKPDLVWNLRKVKTSKEIKWLRKSAEIASKGMKKASEIIEPGRTEIEIAAEIEYEMRRLGSEGTPFDTIVAGGENSWLPHAEATGKTLEEEELVTIDLGARWKGYNSDMTRTFSISPNSKQKEILKISKKAQKAALEKIRSGVEAKEVDEAARKVFRKNNYEKFYLHGSGHGVGLEIHEPPNISPSSEDVLEEGMITTVEPGIYVRKTGGCRFEDMVIVKENGYEKLTSV